MHAKKKKNQFSMTIKWYCCSEYTTKVTETALSKRASF